MLPIRSQRYARMLGLDLVSVSGAETPLIGAFEMQTGMQLSDLPEMVNGFWSSWERCSVGLHRFESDFLVDS